MIQRTIKKELKSLAKQFPIVSVTGARQCGKTTLIKDTFKDYEYINLEEPSIRQKVINDPTQYLKAFKKNIIIDEAQYVPDIFSSVQVLSDADERPGRFILSGSQNFLLLQNITQSLAGRVGILKLPTLSYNEIKLYGKDINSTDFITKGSYPRLYNSNMESAVYYKNYIDTYITRDIKDLLDVRNTKDFKRLLYVLAARAGQLINYVDIAKDLKIDQRTVKSWINILESSYICFMLYPYYGNINKTLVKTPKIYFTDTGLLCYLLNVTSNSDYYKSQYRGHIFENFVISEVEKNYLNSNKESRLFYYREKNYTEVDLVNLSNKAKYELVEIKGTSLYKEKYKRNILKVADYLNCDMKKSCIVYDSEGCFNDNNIQILDLETYLSNI